MDCVNALDSEAIRLPEGKDEEKTDEGKGPG